MGKLSYEYVKNIIESVDGFTLLDNEYINTTTRLNVKCPKGHIFHPFLLNFKKGTRCNHPECKNGKISKSNLNQYDDIKKYINGCGYTLLSKKYTKSIDKLDICCPNGHHFKMRYSAFQQGQRCPICNNKKKRKTFNDVKSLIEKEGYYLLSTTYKNAFDKLLFMCPKKHKFKMRFNSFQQGQRCPLCALSIQKSKPEVEIFNYIKNKYDYDVISGDRNTIINPKTGRFLELDILLPDINKAIEYNAIHWHEGEYIEYKDRIKKEQCKVLGIDLLVIDHLDWIKNKNFEKIDNWIGVRVC